VTPTVAFLGLAVVLLLALAKRSRRIRRRLARTVAELCATVVEYRNELSVTDAAAHLAKLRIHGIGLQNGSLRRANRALVAERDDAHMEAARTLRHVWKLQAENAALTARVQQLELDGELAGLERQFELETGP
jgi:hypothetical protein